MRIIVGISGASGVIMGHALLTALRKHRQVETHLVVTKGARKTWELECDIPIQKLYELADFVHDDRNLAASISSGSFQTDGMVIIPCSMKTLAAVTTGYAANLLVRAADVCMKEGRKVILVPREMPLGKIHLRNLKEASDLGCTIIPPVLTFYNGGQTVEEQMTHLMGKILRQFGLEEEGFVPWEGAE
ncbi:MAG: UbiX family flavin prenyltransferase [Coriobacteriales bacterium]|jgi:4-hydroxy-3-polyprenylbenzoate decarboxylase|nr:UbiX family flavin prenyltransferase [Coriobacteriales bacterium]